VASGKPYAKESFIKIDRLLDSYLIDWQKMHTETCKATHVFAKQSDKELPQWEPIEEDKISSVSKAKSIEKDNSKQRKNDVYKFGEYNLYKKEIQISNEKSRIVHFFSKTKPDDSESATLPDGYTVKINKKTGVPYIKKKT